MKQSERIDRILNGFIILVKYADCEIAAEHDEIFFGPANAAEVTDDDRKKLEELGWRYSAEFETWRRFV